MTQYRVAEADRVLTEYNALIDALESSLRLVTVFETGSRNRAFYEGKAQAYMDAIKRVLSLIEGDGHYE